MTEEELKEIEEFYDCRLLAWHDKGEQAEIDIPKLIKYIRKLEDQIYQLGFTPGNLGE